MARFLKALQGLQSLEPVTPEKSPEVQDLPGNAPERQVESEVNPVSQADLQPQPSPSSTIVMDEEGEQLQTSDSSEKDELVKKLTQQLTIALKQRDAVAEEMLRVREKLESNDQRREEEIVRLRDSLVVHERSAKSIENELKNIEAELRQQLIRQQEEFVQRLGDVERQVREHAESSLPVIPEAATEAELRQFQADLRQQMVREKEEFVQRLAEIENRMNEQAEMSAQAKRQSASQGNNEAELKALQSKLQDQMVRQQEEFVQRIGEVEKQVRKQAERPPAAPGLKPAAAQTASASGMGELFHAQTRSHETEKQIPDSRSIRQALTWFDDSAVAGQFDELAHTIFGGIDFQCISQPEVIFIGTCLPGHDSSDLVLGLATWLSQHSCDVLVIDGALRKKELTQRMGLRTSPGLFEFVRRETYRQDGTYRHTDTGISFVPAGKSSFVLTTSETDFSSLRDQLREIVKTYPIVLIVGEGPDLSTSWLLAQVATKTYLQAPLGQVSGDDVRAAVDCFLQLGIEPAGLVATNSVK